MESITFLYQLVDGTAARSYGLNVARLANLPEDIVKIGSHKSHQLEDMVMKRRSAFVKDFHEFYTFFLHSGCCTGILGNG